MVPGPAGESGGANEGHSAENTVSWATKHSQLSLLFWSVTAGGQMVRL